MATSDVALLGHLLSLRESKGSALVDVVTGDLTTTLVVEAGELIGVTASSPGEPLGRILRRKGMLTQEHYVEVLERIVEVLSIGDEVRFGEVAVGLGYAKAEDVTACLTAQRRGLVRRVFQSTSATWTIRALPDDRDRSGDGPMNVEAIFLDTVRWLDDSRKGELGLDAARLRALAPEWDLAEIDRRFELTQDEADFVRLALAGDKTTSELRSLKTPDVVDVDAILAALVAAKAVVLRAPGPPQVHPSHPVPATAGRDAPTWATVDPDRARGAVVKVTKARSTSAAKKAAGDQRQQALEAERAFQRGRDLFRTDDIAGALPHFEEASAADPTNVEYPLFAEWCKAGQEPTPAVRAKLLDRVQVVLRHDPSCAFAYFVQAEVLRSEGQSNEARVQLARALRLDAELFEGIRAKRAARLRSSRHSWSDEGPPPATASEEKAVHAAVETPQAPSPPPQFVPLDTEPSPPPPRRPPPLRALLAFFVLLGLIGVVALTATAIRRPSTIPSTLASTAPPVSAFSSSGAPAARPPPAAISAAPAASNETPPAADAGGTGTLVFAKSALGHRRYVDGHLNESHSPKLEVACGRHEVRIGSHGTPRVVQVPCGGEILVK